MNELVRATALIGNKPLARGYTSQTVIQTMAELRRRRAWMISLNVATCLAFVIAAGIVLASDGWTLLDTVYLVCIALTAPWAAMGFWRTGGRLQGGRTLRERRRRTRFDFGARSRPDDLAQRGSRTRTGAPRHRQGKP